MTQTNSALIVDDSPDNREVFRYVLEDLRYTVMEANNGLNAIDHLDENTFDLMLLDLQMPSMDGEAVLEDARRDPRHDDMVIVVVTAETHRATSQVMELASYVMTKPIDVFEFGQFLLRLKNAGQQSAV